MKRLEDRVAIITGAASGMGKAMALLFASEGAKVIVSDINQNGVDTVVNEIESLGGNAFGQVANVGKEEDIRNMINATIEHFGAIDILVNNAGIMDNMEPVADVTNDNWNKLFAVNVNGPFFAMRSVIPLMLKQGEGIIINNASLGGLYGGRAGASYTATKHALIGLTKSTAFMYGTSGIRCNAIAPGGVKTNIGSSMTNVNAFGMEKQKPGFALMPRVGEPEEIATVALFLASSESAFINGQVITADGGWSSY
ncbi:MAG: 3-ketoacyl-ACP reductase [Segetibacter sp.]|nr:3-ketoacyl-ACP reductase [Segetibacter sp.]